MDRYNNFFYEKALNFVSKKCFPLTTKALQASQNQLSSAYRKHCSTATLKSPETVLAYAAARMPATYHAVQSCYQKLGTDFQPQTLLDLGAGPGTASLAALDYWQNLKQVTLIEDNPLMYAFQKSLWQYLNPDLRNYKAINDSLHSLGEIPSEDFDMVVLSYVLGELELIDFQEVITQMLKNTRHYGLIVTPGTPNDFQYLLKARDLLLSKGAVIIAPCPHQDRCPLSSTKDWCHFSVRLQRSSLHQSAKKASLGYEDEKFSYLLFSKSVPSLSCPQGRVIRKPIRCSGHILLDICENGQLNRHIVSKADTNFRKTSKIRWGDPWQ